MYFLYINSMKQCTKCNSFKELSEFPKNKRFKDGHNCICKSCCSIINKNYRLNNLDSFNKTRKLNYIKNIDKNRADKREYYKNHKSEKSEYDVKYRLLNKDKIKQYKKDWEFLNKENPIIKIKRNLRRRINHALHGKNKSKRTFELIGCSPEEFKSHLESLFLKDMSWNNYGEWHIDHILPCASFNLLIPEEQEKCFHYSNQQPLWKLDNLKKSKNIL